MQMKRKEELWRLVSTFIPLNNETFTGEKKVII